MLKMIPLNNVYLIGVILCVVIVGFFYVTSLNNNGVNLLQHYKLLPTEQSYTELYIDSHQTLPNYLAPGREATASFTIRNYEHTNKNYKFIITSTLKNKTNVIGSGSAMLKHNESKDLDFHYYVATTEPKTKIEIALPQEKQAIHFWVNNQ